MVKPGLRLLRGTKSSLARRYATVIAVQKARTSRCSHLSRATTQWEERVFDKAQHQCRPTSRLLTGRIMTKRWLTWTAIRRWWWSEAHASPFSSVAFIHHTWLRRRLIIQDTQSRSTRHVTMASIQRLRWWTTLIMSCTMAHQALQWIKMCEMTTHYMDLSVW